MIEMASPFRRTDSDDVVLSVIAPCFNEQDNIGALVDRMLSVFEEMNLAAELVLVDDGSMDATWAAIVSRAMRDPRVRPANHETNRGIEAAWRSGLDAARGELICLIDADLQNKPEDIPILYKKYLQQLPDIVQAVRHPVPKARCRYVFSRGLNLLLNAAFRMRLRDNKSGFLLCRRDVLANLLRHRYRYRYYQCLIGAAAGSHGYSIAEVDTDFERRHAGRSFLSRFPVLVSLRTFWDLVKYRVETWAHRHAAREGWRVRTQGDVVRA